MNGLPGVMKAAALCLFGGILLGVILEKDSTPVETPPEPQAHKRKRHKKPPAAPPPPPPAPAPEVAPPPAPTS